MAPDFLVIVPKADDPESHRRNHSEPNKNIAEVRPKQSGNKNAEKDQYATHRGRSGLGVVRLRAVFPDVLANLEFLELPDQPRPQSQREKQRSQAGVCRPKSNVVKKVENVEVLVKGSRAVHLEAVIELLEKQNLEARS